MNVNGSICKSVSDKRELFDSERDITLVNGFVPDIFRRVGYTF